MIPLIGLPLDTTQKTLTEMAQIRYVTALHRRTRATMAGSRGVANISIASPRSPSDAARRGFTGASYQLTRLSSVLDERAHERRVGVLALSRPCSGHRGVKTADVSRRGKPPATCTNSLRPRSDFYFFPKSSEVAL